MFRNLGTKQATRELPGLGKASVGSWPDFKTPAIVPSPALANRFIMTALRARFLNLASGVNTSVPGSGVGDTAGKGLEW